MRILVCALLFLCCSFQPQECIDVSFTKFISATCKGDNCFRIISRCKFIKYRVDVFDRDGAKYFFSYETKKDNIDSINIFMNNLITSKDLESDTYQVKFQAYRYTDTTVKLFLTSLFKETKKN